MVDGNALILESNTTLYGEGTIKCYAEDANTKVLFASSKENITIRDLNFDGNFSGNNTTSLPEVTFTSFIRFADSTNIRVEDCSFTDLMGTSLQIASCNNITIQNCSFTKMRTVYTGNFFISIGYNSNNYVISNCSFIQPSSYVPVVGHSNGAIVLAGETSVSQVTNGRITGCYFERVGRYADATYDGHNAPRGDIDIYNDIDGLVVSNNVSKNGQYDFFKANDCSHIIVDSNVVTDTQANFIRLGNRYGNYPIEFITISNNISENSSGIKMDGDGPTLQPLEQINIVGNIADMGTGTGTWAVRVERAGSYVNISDNNFVHGEIEITGVAHSDLEFPNTYKKYSVVNNRIDVRNQTGVYGIQMFGNFIHPTDGQYIGGTIRDNTILNCDGSPIYLAQNSSSAIRDNLYHDVGTISPTNLSTLLVPQKNGSTNNWSYDFEDWAALEKQRFTLDCDQNYNSILCKLSLQGGAASNSASSHPAAEYIFRVIINSDGTSVIDGPTAVYETGFSSSTDFTFTSAGSNSFHIDIANPSGSSLDRSSFKFEAISGRGLVLSNSVI